MEPKQKNNSIGVLLIIIAVGIWAIILQNAGVIPTSQNVYVKGGKVDVRGSVSVDNTVDNTVDINIDKINGIDNAFYQDVDGDLIVLPVMWWR